MINTWFCLEESSNETNREQFSIFRNTHYHAFCLHECFHAVLYSWVLACFLRTACIVWLLWSVYPCCGEVQPHEAVPSWTLPLSSLPWLNSVLLTGRWQFSTSLNCDSHISDCTDDVSASTALLMVSALLSLPHQQKHMGTFMFHKAPRTREKENRWNIDCSQTVVEWKQNYTVH